MTGTTGHPVSRRMDPLVGLLLIVGLVFLGALVVNAEWPLALLVGVPAVLGGILGFFTTPRTWRAVLGTTPASARSSARAWSPRDTLAWMSSQARKLLEDALKLPPEARAALAGSLIESLDETLDEDALAEWESEIAKRIAALDDGSAKPIPWSEARRSIVG